MRYSPSLNAFFPESIQYPLLPPDVLTISDELYRSLLDAQGSGYLIEAGSDGIPMAVAPTPDEIPAPQSCSPAQGLVALYALKQITEDHVLEAISQIPDQVQQYTARIGYQHATTWERGSPTMQAMAQLLQLSDEDLDELFSYAVQVQV